jgi:hypothetical protein
VGITSIIISGAVQSFDNATATAFYPTLIPGLRAHGRAVEFVLRAAAFNNISCIVGLVRSGYSNQAQDANYIGAVANLSLAVLGELHGLYGNFPAFQGVYLPQELSNGVCTAGKPTNCTICCVNCTCCFGDEQLRKLLVRTYMKPLTTYAKRLVSNWTTLVAPDFYTHKNANISSGQCGGLHGGWCGTPEGTFMQAEEYAEWWGRVLAEVPGLDVIAHQVGTFHNLTAAVHARLPLTGWHR